MRFHLALTACLIATALGATSARAISIEVTEATAPVSLVRGQIATFELSLTPSPAGVKGYTIFFEVTDATSIVIQSCAVPSGAGDSPICPIGATAFNFGKLDFDPSRDTPFVFATVEVTIANDASVGAQLILSEESTITTGLFEDVGVSRRVIAEVIPEPTTALLLAIGLVGIGTVRRIALEAAVHRTPSR